MSVLEAGFKRTWFYIATWKLLYSTGSSAWCAEMTSGRKTQEGGHICTPACVHSLQSCPALYDPMDFSPLSMGFSRQEYWSGLSCPPPGDVPNPGTEPLSLVSPSLAGGFTTSATWEAYLGVKDLMLLFPFYE